MKRRGFFGFAAGAAVAGPSIAKTAIASGMESMQVGGFGGLVQGAQWAGNTLPSEPAHEYDPVAWARRDLAEFLGKSAADLMEERIGTHVERLDADIAEMKAIRLGAKVRLQRDRNFERQRKHQKGWLERNLANVLKSF